MEVECQNQAEAEEALTAGADVVMLDNLQPAVLHEAATNIKKKFPHAIIEASGGVTLANLPTYFHPSIDVISMGSLTQSTFSAVLSICYPPLLLCPALHFRYF